ncbi:MAG: ATP-binding protein, partial [Bacteroidota bacterium]
SIYADLFRKSTTLLIVYDEDGNLIAANQLLCGSEINEAKGQTWKQKLPDGIVNLKLEKIQEVKETGKIAEFPMKFEYESGCIHYKCLLKPVGQDLGKDHYLMEMMDVTELVQSKAALEEEKSFSEAITDTVPFIVYVLDLHSGKIVYSNRDFAKHIGHSVKEMNSLPNGIVDLVIPEDKEGMQQMLKAYMQGTLDGVQYIEYRIDSGNKGVRELAAWIRPFKYDDDGNLRQIVGVSQDMTEIRDGQRMAHKQDLFYKEIYNGATDNLVVFNGNAELIMVNHPDFWDGLENVIGHKWMEFFSEEVIQKVKEGIAEAAVAEKHHVFEATDNIKGANRTFLNRMKRISGLKDRFLLTSTDITELYSTQKQLELIVGYASEQHEELAEANQELEQFAYIASHDLQAPVRHVNQFLELIRQRASGDLDQESLRYLELCQQSSNQMIELINGLLDFSRLGRRAVEVELINGMDFIEQTVSFEEKRLKEVGGSITMDPFSDFYADPVLYRQLFQNILSNCIKFRESSRPLQIHIGYEENEEFVAFSISDNGVGIDERVQDQVFAVFNRGTGSKDIEGNGIGLSLAKRIVERHGGNIGLRSTLGEGTIV